MARSVEPAFRQAARILNPQLDSNSSGAGGGQNKDREIDASLRPCREGGSWSSRRSRSPIPWGAGPEPFGDQRALHGRAGGGQPKGWLPGVEAAGRGRQGRI